MTYFRVSCPCILEVRGNTDHINDPVLKAIHKYNKHPSILLLKDTIEVKN